MQEIVDMFSKIEVTKCYTIKEFIDATSYDFFIGLYSINDNPDSEVEENHYFDFSGNYDYDEVLIEKIVIQEKGLFWPFLDFHICYDNENVINDDYSLDKILWVKLVELDVSQTTIGDKENEENAVSNTQHV